MAKRVAQMGGTASQVAAYTGIAKQFVVDTTNWRVHLMNGTTAGGIRLARFDEIPAATDLSGYLLKTDASSTYLTKTNASSTYLTKTDASSTYLGKTDKAASAKIADTATNAIPKAGSTGSITTYETLVAATTVSDTSARSMSLADGGTLTVNNGSAGGSWITVVALAGSATVNLGAAWSWSGSAPTLAKGLVTCAWYGTFGVATFTKFGS